MTPLDELRECIGNEYMDGYVSAYPPTHNHWQTIRAFLREQGVE